MAVATRERLEDALRAILYPGYRRDIVTLGMVTDLRVEGDTVHVDLRPGTDKSEIVSALRASVEAALRREPGVARVVVTVAARDEGRGRDPFAGRAPIAGVRQVIAVASTKGGVGKSTVATNLAVTIAAGGRRAGLIDADVYGPSLPIMMGTSERPRVSADKRITPVERFGVKCMSMGFFLDQQSPVIWRGPIVMGIVRQFLKDVDWGDTEILVVDLPPGTGDAPLTLVQQVPVTGGVIVTTPQDVALLDVGRGIAMFAQVATPVLGIVENMAGYVCSVRARGSHLRRGRRRAPRGRLSTCRSSRGSRSCRPCASPAMPACRSSSATPMARSRSRSARSQRGCWLRPTARRSRRPLGSRPSDRGGGFRLSHNRSPGRVGTPCPR
jgi:ATP-binding protein involved in chromosome partitioning